MTVNFSSGSQFHSELWQAAYARLDGGLKQRYEVVLKGELNVGLDTNLDQQAILLVERRKQRVLNRQWTYKWRGRPRKVREQVDTILDLVQKSSNIISVGMNFAPIYVSLPWTAITTLLPFVTNDSKEHNMALKGLEQLAEIMARYRIVENIHIEPASMTFTSLKNTVVDLYSKIFEYQARLADYLGKNTLRRFGINSLQLGGWSELIATISSIDTSCQAWMSLHDSEASRIGDRYLADLMAEQTKGLEAITQRLTHAEDERTKCHEILSWITEHDAFEDHDESRDRIGDPYLSSGQWLFRTAEFKNWMQSHSGVLILRGSVGTGKSSLISIIVEHLLNTTAIRRGFYYCSCGPMADSSARTVILSILRQLALAGDTHSVNSAILDKYERRTQKSWNHLNLPWKDLLNLMLDVLDEHPEAIVVVDALDECADYEDLLKFFNEVSDRSQTLRFLFSARPHITTRSKLTNANHIDELDVADHTGEDIQDFLKTELALDSRGENDMPSVHQATILYELLGKLASGMFRWVRLQVDLFLRIELSNDFDSGIQRLTKTTLHLRGDDRVKLYTAYDDMYDANVGRKPTDLDAVQAEREAVVQRIFLWALCAHRPLRVSEMLEAVSVNDNGSIVKGVDEAYLLSKGSNFIRRDVQNRVVFTHLSVREYLTKPRNSTSDGRFSLDAASWNAIAARRCISSMLSREPCQTDWEILTNSLPSQWSFYSYCCTYWIRHLRSSERFRDSSSMRKALFAYTTCIMARTPSLLQHSEMDNQILYRYATENTGPISAAAVAQMIIAATVAALSSMLQDGQSGGVSASLAIVQCLAACGIPLSTEGPSWREENLAITYLEGGKFFRHDPKTLMELAIMRNDSLIEMLLHYGARVDVSASHKPTLLHVAAEYGTVEGMRMLLKSQSAATCLTIPQHDGLMPIDVALAEQNFGCADILWSALLENDETPIPDSTAKSYTMSLCRARGEARGHRTTLTGVQISESAPTLTFSQDSTLCDWCRKLFINYDSPIFQHFSLGSPNELAKRAAWGCQTCSMFEKRGFGYMGSKKKIFNVQSRRFLVYWAAMPGLLCSTYYSRRAGLLFLMLWGCLVLYYKQNLDLNESSRRTRVEVSMNSKKRSFRERYMNIWTLETIRGTQVLVSEEFEICQSRGRARCLFSYRMLMLKINTESQHPDITAMNGENSSSSERIRSRPLNEDTFGQAAINMIQAWLSKCEGHDQCQPFSLEHLPTLVLDNSSPDRLILRNGEGLGRYCAYSGVWGSKSPLLTTRSNVMAFKVQGIPLERLPRSWRDATELARLLGFRYIWIDALCIIQDDEQSWKEESIKISDYYQKANLVIASAHSESSAALRYKRPIDSTLLTLNCFYPPTQGENSLESQRKAKISIRTPLEDGGTSLVQSAWAKRGWTMGERYLARRMLIFGVEQTYWNCNTYFFSEGSTKSQEPLWRIPESAAHSGDRSTWYRLIEYHTSTALTTVQSDRLFSVSNLAVALANGDRYWAGIWQEDLYVGLLWRKTGPEIPFSTYTAPSWSWACLASAVSFHTSNAKRLETSDDAEVIELSLELRSVAAFLRGSATLRLSSLTEMRDEDAVWQYGPVKSGFLVLSAKSRISYAKQEASPGTYVFDYSREESEWHRSGNSIVIALISQWENLAGIGCRWHGMLLQELGDAGEDGRERYKRVGVYIGPLREISRSERTANSPTSGPGDVWERREFHIL